MQILYILEHIPRAIDMHTINAIPVIPLPYESGLLRKTCIIKKPCDFRLGEAEAVGIP